MSGFEYFRPSGAHHKVSIRDWNSKFARRGKYPFVVVNVYLGRDTAVVHFNVSVLTKILMWLLCVPFYIVFSFLSGVKETHECFCDVVFDKSRGSFSVESFQRKDIRSWLKLMSLIGRNKY